MITRGASLTSGKIPMIKKSLLTLMVMILAACGSSDGPRKTVENYLSRIEDRNASGANDLLCDTNRVTLLDQSGFERVSAIDFRTIKYTSVNEDSSSANIRITGMAVMEQSNQHVEMKIDTIFMLTAQNDTWCIQEVGSIRP